LATANLPASLTVNSLFPQSPRRTYFYREEVGQAEPRCTPGLRLYQRLMEVERTARLANQNRLRMLSLEHRDEVQLFCSHDALELQRMQAKAS